MSELPKVRLPVLQPGTPARLEEPLTLSNMPFLPADVPVFDHAAFRASGARALRTSSYAIWIDLPDGAGGGGSGGDEMLLIHGDTGAHDKVSRRVVAYLRALDGGKRREPLHGSWSSEPGTGGGVEAPSDSTIQRLNKRGYLTQMTINEEESFFTKAAATRHLR